MITEILWGPRSTGIYDPSSELNDELEPYASNNAEIVANVPSYQDMQAKGSDWVVSYLKRVCNGHVAGCAYNDY
eukprot:CAMPEP_0184304906 /NCGR_PEP_ID=MMETSP1049-20130417/14318_1 /TAXON_ID=77928 /ORGANISM="Proteomonas sulcata, Strain CCMP704" /LENGTH=73 /DNA_ID=CAMNT_0026616845 /DNA_START=109 /DNA_END=330 /DNA_ORIENTATION=+